MIKKTKKIHVTSEFHKFIRQKKAENPEQFKTTYDVLDSLMEKTTTEKKNKNGFWAKI